MQENDKKDSESALNSDLFSDLLADLEAYFRESVGEPLQDALEFIPAEYRDQAKDFHKKTITYVQENPVKSVAIAFAAGFVLSRLLRRKDS